MLKSLGLDMPAAKAKDQNGQDAVGECQDENWNVWSQKVSNQEKFHLWFLIKIKQTQRKIRTPVMQNQLCEFHFRPHWFSIIHGSSTSEISKGFVESTFIPSGEHHKPWSYERFFCWVCFAKTLKKYRKDTGAYSLILLRSTICWFINSGRSLGRWTRDRLPPAHF